MISGSTCNLINRHVCENEVPVIEHWNAAKVNRRRANKEAVGGTAYKWEVPFLVYSAVVPLT